MICASITEKTVDLMVKFGNKSKADLVELRLDCLKNFDGLEKLGKIKKPMIATCMPKWEGGLFNGTEKQRLRILEETLDFASYVTIELKTKPDARNRLIKKAKKKKVKVIVAYHDFRKTPPKKEILKIINEEKTLGDIAKVAFMPRSHDDVLNLINILVEKKPQTKIIALSMGKLGRISRLLGPLLGSYLTYASVSKEKRSAPGQLTVDELREMLSIIKTK